MKFKLNSFLKTFVWILSLVLIMTFVLSADVMAAKDKKKGPRDLKKYLELEDLTKKQEAALTKIWATSKKAKEYQELSKKRRELKKEGKKDSEEYEKINDARKELKKELQAECKEILTDKQKEELENKAKERSKKSKKEKK